MRISTRGRYGLAALTVMAATRNREEPMTVASLATRLGISKIYLEQVFSLLKRADIVTSIKGAQGGYHLNGEPDSITVLNILSALEQSLFERTEDSVQSSAPEIEDAMRRQVFDPLNGAVCAALLAATLQTLATAAARSADGGYMFYI